MYHTSIDSGHDVSLAVSVGMDCISALTFSLTYNAVARTTNTPFAKGKGSMTSRKTCCQRMTLSHSMASNALHNERSPGQPLSAFLS